MKMKKHSVSFLERCRGRPPLPAGRSSSPAPSPVPERPTEVGPAAALSSGGDRAEAGTAGAGRRRELVPGRERV
jgi:hypothetical protein